MFNPLKPKAAPAASRVQPMAPARAVTWAACKAAATRSANWARGEIEAPDFVPDVLALYKAPVAFDLAGQAATAGAVLRLIDQQLAQDGDFHRSSTMAPATGRSYRNAWLAWGAQRLGAYHLSRAALDRLERTLHAEMWGVPEDDYLPVSERRYDLGSNASALNAMLAAGRMSSAEKIGGFMAGLIVHHAPASKRVLLTADARGHLVDPGGGPGHGSGTGRYGSGANSTGLLTYDIGAPGQVHWTLGFALRGFAQLYRATGQKVWLEPAARIGEWLEHGHPDHATHITSAKLGWGAAELYAATGEEHWADLALRVTGHILATQDGDGLWLRPEFTRIEDQPLAISLDTALERLAYLSEIPRALAQGGKVL